MGREEIDLQGLDLHVPDLATWFDVGDPLLILRLPPSVPGLSPGSDTAETPALQGSQSSPGHTPLSTPYHSAGIISFCL